MPPDLKLRLLGDEAARRLLAVTQPLAQLLLAARLEQRRVRPALERTHGLVNLDGPQRTDVLLEREHERRLLRHDLRARSLKLGVPVGELLREAAQVRRGGALRRALHHELMHALRRRGEPRAADLGDGPRLQEMQAKAALVVEERLHERRHVGLQRRTRQLRGRELRGHLELKRRHRLPLGR